MRLAEEIGSTDWQTSPLYESGSFRVTSSKFYEITDLLLERPDLNSSHLFRADILFDSSQRLRTVREKEAALGVKPENRDGGGDEGSSFRNSAEVANGRVKSPYIDLLAPLALTLRRTVIRRLIPRKPQLDPPLTQSCFVLAGKNVLDEDLITVVYVPHIASEEKMPWYHPPVKALAYQYKKDKVSDSGVISIHFMPFPTLSDPLPTRLHRTFLSLLQTFVRLSKMDSNPVTSASSSESDGVHVPPHARDMNPRALKDTILPQHTVQDTYTRLKQTYAADLIARWVEKTDPSKHVFEDLAIAAFLLELWGNMYKEQQFPGFVDIACGNGVLVYVLVKEGYRGRGFDAKRRRTWDALDLDNYLDEKLCIPKPFLDLLDPESTTEVLNNIEIHDGTFDSDTFIISNHADELTIWTPILAALSNLETPLPFLAIPCCSHALSGAKHRYVHKDIAPTPDKITGASQPQETEDLSQGDLKTLRAKKQKEFSHTDDKSAYACLTRKTVAIAEELGFETEVTLMRIPSTRNIGIVGNRHLKKDVTTMTTLDDVVHNVDILLDREAARSGGLKAAAQVWIERAQQLLQGKGRGKVNLRRSGDASCGENYQRDLVGVKE